MKLETIPIEQIQRAKYNPRVLLTPADPEYKRLKKTVDKFGLVEPLVWNKRSGNLVGGHQRLSILEARGDVEVEVSVVDLDDRDEKTLNLALNKHSGNWDNDLLGSLLRELNVDGFDFDVTGFEFANIGGFLNPGTKGKTDEDLIPDISKHAKTKPGDLYILGDHRILCGDSTKSDQVARLMNGQRATLFATDPPYLVDYDGMAHPSKIGKDRPTKNKNWTDSYQEGSAVADGGRQFYLDFCKVAIEHAITSHAAWYCWHASRHQAMVESVWTEIGVLFHQQLIWYKSRPVLGYAVYMYDHEPCFFGWMKGNKPRVTKGKQYPRTVWNIPSSEVESKEHPTSKPTRIFKIPIELHVKSGEICYEPFSGSGSQIIAAEATGRACYAMELTPVFVDVAVKRWELFTGKKAKLERDAK
jgi:DNA modification methylase